MLDTRALCVRFVSHSRPRRYPEACAVLVRRHGVYVWGDTWQQAKTMNECYDYLFEIAWKMRQLGLDPAKPPIHEEAL